MAVHPQAIDNALAKVLESEPGIIELQRACDLLHAMRVSEKSGQPVSMLVDLETIESTPELALVLANLLEANPDIEALESLAREALKCRLLEAPAPFIV
jgi:hypothetical protein